MEQSSTTVTPALQDFRRCWNFLTRFDNSLRAGDALHLAIADNRCMEQLYTLDNGLLEAGEFLGIPVSKGID